MFQEPIGPRKNQSETAEYLGVKRHTLSVWRCRKYGPPWIKVGARVYYAVADLEAWLHQQRVVPQKSAA